MISKLKKLAIGAVAAGGLLVCQGAVAGLLTVNLGGFVCPDNAVCDTNPLVNVVTVQAGVNGVPLIPGYTVAITIGTSNNPGGPTFSLLDVTWNVNTLGPGAAGGPLTILVSQTDFNFPGTPLATLESVCGGDVLNGSVTCQQWANLSNTLFGLGPVTPGPQGPFTAPFASDLTINYATVPTPYSITDRLIFSLSPQATSTGDLRSTVRIKVPEPATLALVGGALLGLGFLRRRKQR
jgi:hypothetical protein